MVTALGYFQQVTATPGSGRTPAAWVAGSEFRQGIRKASAIMVLTAA